MDDGSRVTYGPVRLVAGLAATGLNVFLGPRAATASDVVVQKGVLVLGAGPRRVGRCRGVFPPAPEA